MTNPSIENNIVNDLLSSGLIPEMIVTENPFYIKKKNILKFFIKKIILRYKYIRNQDNFLEKFQPYFLARKYKIPLYNSYKVNTKEFEKKVKSLEIDYIFTFGFKILKENIISVPKKGCINFHPAFLPKNRGATPSKWIILENQKTTGITFHYINKGIDTGDIIEQYLVPLSGYESAKILNNYLFNLGSILLVRLIYKIKNKIKISTIENTIDLGSYQPPFKKENSLVSNKNTFNEICNIINASQDGYRNAVYNYNNSEFEILNFVEVTDIFKNKKTPFVDSNGNVIIKTKENRLIMLIRRKN